MTYTGFFFEANSIQAYIVQGGRLRDIVGASYLLDQLCTTDIDAICKQLNLRSTDNAPNYDNEILFTRKASGAIYAVLRSPDTARLLAATWSLWVRHRCPGLSFNQAMCTADQVFEVVEQGTAKLGHSRSTPASPLPVAPPLVERSSRTGLAVVPQSGASKHAESADAAVAARRSVLHLAQKDNHKKLLPTPSTTSGQRFAFPVNLEHDTETDSDQDVYQFPFDGHGRWLGVLHADGNGLGQILLSIIAQAKQKEGAGEHYPEFLASLSKAVAQSTEHAAQEAANQVLLPKAHRVPKRAHPDGRSTLVMPARPIVLAGDDLTIILRADIAFDYVNAFSTAFEIATREAFATLKSLPCAQHFQTVLPERLTICAGLQFVKNTFPFVQALHLAEDLCSAAKQQSKASIEGSSNRLTPASLCFSHMTTSMTDASSAQHLPGLGAYALGEPSRASHTTPLPRLDALITLAKTLHNHRELKSGPMRRLLNQATTNPAEAQIDYGRWRQLTRESSPGALSDFDHMVSQIHPSLSPAQSLNLPIASSRQNSRWLLPDLFHVLATLPVPATTSNIEV